MSSEVDVTDRAGRILGRVGVDILTFPAGMSTAALATDAGLASVFARLGDGSTRVIVDSLPVGLATSALQGTANASLAGIDGKTPALVGGKVPVDVTFPGTQAVTGTFWQATQPVSAASLPLPSGAATEATMATLLTAAQFQARVNTLGQKTMANSTPVVLSSDQSAIPVTGTFWQATQPVSIAGTLAVSAASLPLPSGAAQEHVAAASPNATRLSDGSAFYDACKTGQLPTSLGQKTMANSLAVCLASDQGSIPVAATCSGTVTANIGTTNGLALDATMTGGNQKSIARGGAKGATSAADVTSTSVDANTQALDVAIKNTSLPVTGTFWQATQPVSLASLPALAAGTANIGDVDVLTVPALFTDGTAKAIQRTAAKGTTAAGDATGSAIDANTHASHVKVKDEGRVRCVIKYHGTSAATADTLQSLTKNLGGTESAGTSIGVTSGKRLKITAIKVTVKANAAAAAFATFNLRSNAAAATVLASPILVRFELGLTAATVGSALTESIECDLEFLGAETLGLSTVVQATTNVLSIELIGYEYTP